MVAPFFRLPQTLPLCGSAPLSIARKRWPRCRSNRGLLAIRFQKKRPPIVSRYDRFGPPGRLEEIGGDHPVPGRAAFHKFGDLTYIACPSVEIEPGVIAMGAREKINELVAFVAELADVDQRRACLAQLDQLLLAEGPPARERSPLAMTKPAGGATLFVGRPD